MILSHSVNNLKESDSFKVLSQAKLLEKKGIKVIHFEIGEPDFNTDDAIKKALVQSLDRNETHYTASQGIEKLKEAITVYEKKFRKINVSSNNIVVASGAKPILLFILLAILNPGEEVLIPDPGYLSYGSLVNFASGKAIPYTIFMEKTNTIDAEEIQNKITKRTKAIILNYPSNPTGRIATPQDLMDILDVARAYNILVISDEVYSRIIYEKAHLSITKFMEEEDKDRVVLVDGFSKTYAMTGWRLGYGILPSFLVKPVVKIVQNSISCVPPFIQEAGIVALESGENFIKKMVSEFQRRRDVIYEKLLDVDRLKTIKPEGAFYFFPEVMDLNMPSTEFARRLLEKFGVAVLPGTSFGKNGEGHIRISFANSLENLEEGAQKLAEFINTL